jgi:hypothetical protein
VVEPVDPFQGGELYRLGMAPGGLALEKWRVANEV